MQQKTKAYAHIDLHNLSIHKEMTLDILERYDYTAPYTHDTGEFDKLLHELMYYCKFYDDVRIEYVDKGKVISEIKPKWKLITSHTARRTFVVCNALRGKTAHEIMRATGHTTYSAYDKYLCYND